MQILQRVLLMLVALWTAPAFAQEGYPLDGTWRGYWGQPGTEGTLEVVVMQWDGKTIQGRINPGRETVTFSKASLDASNWVVHFEATSKDGQPIVVEGKLENIGSYNRTITGTWTQGGVAHPIVLTRE